MSSMYFDDEIEKVGTEGTPGAYLLWDIPNIVNNIMK